MNAADTREVHDLVARLHELVVSDDIVTFSSHSAALVDECMWITERLRVLTSPRYSECAYGSES